ncbi:unnamed protein product [Aphanomyces euteiches]
MEEAYDEKSLWRDRSKIFVAGLPLDADDAALEAKFQQFGPMFQAKVVYDNKTQRSRGFGFVTFQSYESALDAVRAMDQTKWDKRVLNVRFLTPKAGGGNQDNATESVKATMPLRVVEPWPEGCTTVFVGNMPYEITEEILRKVMSVCGDIKAIRFAEDIKTKEFRGFGYVQFFEGEAAEKAVQELHGTVVMGRPLKIDYGARDAPQVSEAKAALEKKLKKGICHKFEQGLCDRGDACKFAHVTPSGAVASAPVVTNDAPVCMAFQKGSCKRGDACNYRHIGAASEAIAAAPEPVVEDDYEDDGTPICLAFQKGKCKRGEQCKFRHVGAAAAVATPRPAVVAPVVHEEEEEDDGTPICQAFQKGKCKRGDNCKFVHKGTSQTNVKPTAIVQPPRAAPATVTIPVVRAVAKREQPAPRKETPKDDDTSDERIICKRFQTKGKCKRGEMCKYIHETSNETDQPQPTVDVVEAKDNDATVVCLSFQKGTCKRGAKCKFSHASAEDVEEPSRKKKRRSCDE